MHNSNSVNYYAPLQSTEMDEFADNISVPEKKPQFEEVNEICKINQITDYSICKISIGINFSAHQKKIMIVCANY